MGSIYPGQPVTFTVDATSQAGRAFDGKTGKVRLNATMTQNVVTYTVEVNTDNFDGKLLPYLTANVQFETGRRDDVLMVPNAALRWNPKPDQIDSKFRQAAETQPYGKKSKSAGHSLAGPNATQPDTACASGPSAGESQPESSTQPAAVCGPVEVPLHPAKLWVQEGHFVRPLNVMAGLTDGSQTEVQGSDLKDGMTIVVGEQSAQVAGGGEASGGGSPFTPNMGKARQPANAPPSGGGGQGGGPGGGGGGGR